MEILQASLSQTLPDLTPSQKRFLALDCYVEAGGQAWLSTQGDAAPLYFIKAS